MSTEHYSARVTKIFERINNIQNNVDDERQNRFKIIENILTSFEANLKEINQSKTDKFQYLAEKLKQLQDSVEEEVEFRSRMETDLASELNLLEKNCKRKIEAFSKERTDADKKLVSKLSTHLDALSTDIQKEVQAKYNSSNLWQQYLIDDVPRLKDEIVNEVATRREVEERIYEQFMEQINELRTSFEIEKRERETREEELIVLLKSISGRAQDALEKTKKDREVSEELLVKLVEQVIEKLKKEMVEADI